MTDSLDNPWVARFAGLLDPGEIRRRVEVRPRPFADARRMSPVQASRELSTRLNEMFYPSAQCVAILLEWMSHAIEHCREHYRDRIDFSAKLFGDDAPFPPFMFPICLTGLAGTGKSQLLIAFARLMPAISTVTTNDRTVFKLESHRILVVRAKDSRTDILAELIGQKGGVRLQLSIARKRAYRLGWAFLGADEFQFMTQSDEANTRLTQVLMMLGYLGIPFVYIANFSMIHKLLRRNQEDRQRLLGNVIGFFPEGPDSQDWVTLLEWQKSICPDIFKFDPKGDARAIHELTSGINRAEKTLLGIAFRRGLETGSAVDLPALERAYQSSEYAMYRSDVKLLSKLSHSPELKKSHKDLWCPLDIERPFSSDEVFMKGRQERVAEVALEESLNASEKAAVKTLTSPALKARRQSKATIVPIANKKSILEQLKEDAAWYEDKQ